MQKTLLLFLLGSAASLGAAQAQAPEKLRLPWPLPKDLTDTLPDVVVVGQALTTHSGIGCIAPTTIEYRTITQPTDFIYPYTTVQPILSRAPGVQVTPNSGAPGDWATVRIRGSSLGGSDQPLYLLDGLPALNTDFAPGPLASLPAYIQGGAVQVSAAAPNPLLFVPPQDIERVDIMEGAPATTRYGSQGANGVINIITKRGGRAGAVQAPQLHYDAQVAVQQVRRPLALLDARQYAELANEVWRNDGSRGQPPFDAATLAGLGAGTDWQRELLAAALLHSHQLSLGGSTSRTRYRASLGYLGQDGVVLNSNLRRYTLGLNLDRTLGDKARVWLNVGAAAVARTLPPAATVPGALLAPPTVAATTATGEPTVTSSGPVVAPAGYAAPFLNPLALARQAPTTDDTRRLLVQAGLSWELPHGLRLEGRLSEELAATQATVRALLRATLADPPTPGDVRRIIERLHTLNAQASLYYEQPNPGKHVLTAETTLLGQHLFRSQETTYPQQTGGPGAATSYAAYPLTVLSALATSRYTYDGRLWASALLRADYSAAAQAGLGFRQQGEQLYPALEAGWNVDQEGFMESNPVLSSLRVSAAVGQCGSSSLPVTALPAGGQPLAGPGLTSLTGALVPVPRTTQWHLGLSAGFLRGQLQVQPRLYYHHTAHANVGQYLADYNPGGPSYTLVLREATLRNQGAEVIVSYSQSAPSHKLAFVTQLTAAYNQQRVLAVEGALPVPGLAAGDSYHPFYGLQRAGLGSSGTRQFSDVNGDGTVDYRDASYFGSGLPSWQLGLNEELRMGRFTLQAQFDALLGYQLFNPVLARLDYPSADVNGSTRLLDRWTPTHTSTDVPAASAYFGYLNRYDQTPASASHLRLSQLTFDCRVRRPDAARQLHLWLGGHNLLVLTNYRGYDPNVSSGGSLGQQAGYDASTYPVARVWQLGVRATL